MTVGSQAFTLGSRYVFRGELLNFQGVSISNASYSRSQGSWDQRWSDLWVITLILYIPCISWWNNPLTNHFKLNSWDILVCKLGNCDVHPPGKLHKVEWFFFRTPMTDPLDDCICTYIHLVGFLWVNVGKYAIHRSYGQWTFGWCFLDGGLWDEITQCMIFSLPVDALSILSRLFFGGFLVDKFYHQPANKKPEEQPLGG